MIIDKQLQFSDSQALTATAASTNIIDSGIDGNLGVGEPMAVVVTIEVAADGANADETYSVALQSDSDVGFGSAVELSSISIPRGSAAGSKFVLPVPADSRGDQYFRVNYTLGGTTPSATVSCHMIPQSFIQNDYYFADGFTVS